MKWAHAHWLMCGSGWTNEMISQWGGKGVIGPKPQQRGDARGTRPPHVLVHLGRFPYSKCYWLIGTLQRAYLRAGTHSQVAQWSRICLPTQETQETWVRFLGQEDPLEKEVATRTSILAWGSHGQRSLAMLWFMGSQKSGDNLWLNNKNKILTWHGWMLLDNRTPIGFRCPDEKSSPISGG